MNDSNRLFRVITAVVLTVSFMLAPLNSTLAGISSYGTVDIATCDVYLADDKKEGDKDKGEKKGKGKDGEEPDCE
jgi:hypothetical protein